MIDYKAIGRNIQAHRKFMNLSQDELAGSVSISVSYLSQIERGLARPSLEILSNIAACVNCTAADLLPSEEQQAFTAKRQTHESAPVTVHELLEKSKSMLSDEKISQKKCIDLINQYFPKLDRQTQQMLCYWVLINSLYKK